MSCPRVFPLQQPKGHRPPVPRWMAGFPSGLDRVYTAYIGVQQHKNQAGGQLPIESHLEAIEGIQQWMAGDPSTAPASVEQFRVLDGDDTPDSTVWVCYWDTASKYEESMRRLNLLDLYRKLDPLHRQSLGLWCERFTSRLSRVETNYSGLDYLPGLARLPGVSTVEHTLTAYWGAARDRIPDSATDLFQREEENESSDDTASAASSLRVTLNHHLVGTNPENLVHIRSGQFWANCEEDETKSYVTTLEPTLRAGLAYLWDNPVQTGASGLRYLANSPRPSEPSDVMNDARESCVAGFFRNLADLERWAKSHPSHLAIYTGAIRHAKKFGEQRKFRTWHEVSVLKRGEAQFEYVNCTQRTGVLRGFVLEDKGYVSGVNQPV